MTERDDSQTVSHVVRHCRFTWVRRTFSLLPQCNCGSHKCPTDRHLYELTPYEKDALRTSYQQNYPGHAVSRVPRRDEFRPRQEAMFGEGKFDAVTTCQSDFRPPNAAPARAARPPAGDPALINGGSNVRAFDSEARTQYGAKPYAVRESFAPTNSHTTQVPFEGTTTAGSDYRSFAGAKPATPFKEPPTVGGSKEDRDFQTEAALKFVQHGDQRRSGFAPPPRGRDSLPFEGTTTAGSDYRSYSGAKPATPFREAPTVGGAKEDRDFQTSAAANFNPKGYAVRESYKPVVDRSAANVPFDAQSTSKSAYTGAAGSKAASAKPRVGLTDTIGVAIGSKDDRAWVSEARGQFDPKGYQARRSYAPTNSHTTQVPFEGTTTAGSDYRSYAGAKPSTPFKEAPTVGGGREDRDFQTEASLKFTAHGDQRRAGFAPTAGNRTTLPFEGSSTSQSDYKPWSREACPALAIPDFPNHPRDADGHQPLTNATGQWQPHVQRR